MKNINVSLSEPLEQFVAERVAAGDYSSASEVIREGLLLLQQFDRERLHSLRVAIRQGIDSGEGRLLNDITVEEIVKRGTERLRRAQT